MGAARQRLLASDTVVGTCGPGATGPDPCHSPRVTSLWGRFAAAYALLGIVSASIAVVLGKGSPLVHPEPWLRLASADAHTYSLAVGLAFGALIVVLTRLLVPRISWARALHRQLRPIAAGISLPGIAVLAILSAIGEELFFRGLLQPWLGLVAQALLFGLLHQVRGPSRWVWVCWATLMGLAIGAIFELTGSLAGPLAAHALVNGLNLAYLKRHNPDPEQRSLGGLLGQRG
jgi:membrane protease YdiL (CAAX protease family)